MAQSDSLIGDYQKLRPTYEAFGSNIEQLIRSLLKAKNIEYFAIERRIKTGKSFEEKIGREDKNAKYKELSDVTDLCGIRIIAYLQEDCDKICKIIEDNFEIDEENSSDKEDELDPDKFGYLSTHYILELSKSRIQLPEFSAFKAIKAEVQVRTLLQHTWAAIDWKFRYKEEREAPKSLRRRLFRISALLEAADNEFSSVKSELDQLKKKYSSDIDKGRLDIPINVESLKSYVKNSQTAKDIFVAAGKGGITVNPTSPNNIPLVYSRVAKSAEIMGIKTLANFDEILSDLIPEGKDFFAYLANETEDERKKDKAATLVRPAVLLYGIMRFATTAQQKSIGKKYVMASGYLDAIMKYSAANKKA